MRIEGNLVPTKVGATLWVEDFEILKEIGPETYKQWQKTKEDILNHGLSDRSDYYLIVGTYDIRDATTITKLFYLGPDQNGEVKFCVKICFQSPGGDALTSTNSGATLNLDGWQKLMTQLDEINNGVNEMQKFVVVS